MKRVYIVTALTCLMILAGLIAACFVVFSYGRKQMPAGFVTRRNGNGTAALYQ